MLFICYTKHRFKLFKTTFLYLFISFQLMGVENRSAAILFNPLWWGECSFAYRIQEAGQRIGWQVDLYHLDDNLEKELIQNKNYDLCIHLSPSRVRFPHCRNYLSIFHPKHHYFDDEGYLLSSFHNFDGYLLSYSPQNLPYPNDFDDSSRFPSIVWYPTVYNRSYRVVQPKALFVLPSTWGNRSQNKYSLLFQLLDGESYTRCYGNEQFKHLLPIHYCSSIPYDNHSLYEILEEIGVTLVIHSKDHNTAQIPSGRIFEAVASSAIVICDCNQFVMENFGQNILYIHTHLSPSLILNEIREHMNWIQEHREEALAMAKRAHEIFVENFLLEDQLLRLGQFHDSLDLLHNSLCLKK